MNRKITAITIMISLIISISLGFFGTSSSAMEYILASLGRVDATLTTEFHSAYGDSSKDYFNIYIDNETRLMTVTGKCYDSYKYGRCIIRYTSDSKYKLIKNFDIAEDGTYSYYIGINALEDGEYFITARFKRTESDVFQAGAYNIRGIPFMVINKEAYFFPHSMVIDQNNQLRAEANFEPKYYLDKSGAEYVETGKGLSKEEVDYLQYVSDYITKGAKSDRAKMWKIHNWVASNLYYDDYAHKFGGAETNPYILANSIASGYATKTVCNGYSSLVTILARCAGVPCRQVKGHAIFLPQQSWEGEGKTLSEVDHFWNEAYVNGRWMVIDATRDTSNKYTEDGQWVTYDFIRYNYFDPSDESLAATHLAIGYRAPIIPKEPTDASSDDDKSEKSKDTKEKLKKAENLTKPTETTTEKTTEPTTITTEVTTVNPTQNYVEQTTLPTTMATTGLVSDKGDTATIAPTNDDNADFFSQNILDNPKKSKKHDDKNSGSAMPYVIVGAVLVLSLASSLSVVFLKKKK